MALGVVELGEERARGLGAWGPWAGRGRVGGGVPWTPRIEGNRWLGCTTAPVLALQGIQAPEPQLRLTHFLSKQQSNGGVPLSRAMLWVRKGQVGIWLLREAALQAQKFRALVLGQGDKELGAPLPTCPQGVPVPRIDLSLGVGRDKRISHEGFWLRWRW